MNRTQYENARQVEYQIPFEKSSAGKNNKGKTRLYYMFYLTLVSYNNSNKPNHRYWR
jgi:hypothetical protein